jgi:hypothetical protein
MLTAVFLSSVVFFLVRFHVGMSYSLNLDSDLGSPSFRTDFSTGGNDFGQIVQSNMDFNNDGFNDILASSLLQDAAYVYFGSSSLTSSSTPLKITGSSGFVFSAGCSFAGDVNKDGYADIIIGQTSNGGTAYLVLGGSTTPSPYSVTAVNSRTITYTPETTGGNFGKSVTGAGDVNRDGFDDFVICGYTTTAGGFSSAGACYLIYGGNNLQSISMSSLGSAGIKIYGSTGDQRLGNGVSGVGDINKDGYADFSINCGDFNNVFLVYGGASLLSFTTTPGSFSGVTFPSPTGPYDGFGRSISAAGDFNGDGTDDLVILKFGGIVKCAVYVIYGGSSLPASLNVNAMSSTVGVRYFPDPENAFSVSGGVDFNRDGFDDIIIGTPYANNNAGAAHIIFGSANPVDSIISQLGNGAVSLNAQVFGNFGSSVGFAKNVAGPNTQVVLVTASNGYVPSTVYYLHDFLKTSAPSVSPTASPTVSPTVGPSAEPTISPSVTPSAPPTATPSTIPSLSPTLVPSVVPTKEPTISPTFIPSFSPSFIPTIEPSASPTMIPTFGPTNVPTFAPSVTPSKSPSVAPSTVPTFGPSVTPTIGPTFVPTVVPSFRPSTPTYSPSAGPTPVPTARTKGSIIVNAGFTVNSVNGATLSPTSQETIKQSIANASQTTPNNVDLVSVTRTNRRLLSSVVHRMLATALFSYKVIAEIHFNLIDFPGLNESYVAGTKSKGLMEAVETHEFDRIISFYATINNASQLMSNVTVLDVIVTTTVIPVPNSEEDSGLSDGQVAGLVIGITVGTILLSGLVYFLLLKVRSKQSAEDSVARYGTVPAAGDAEITVDVSQIYQERNDQNLNRTQTLDMIKASSEIII